MLEDGFTFLNHGAFGATLRGCLDSKQRWAEHIEHQPVRFLDRELFPHLVQVSKDLAFLTRARPQDLMPIPSATAGMNLVLRSWQRRFRPGPEDRVLVLSVAYGSTKSMLSKMSQESGFQIDEASIQFPFEDEQPILEALSSALRPNTSLVVLDIIPSNAPFVLPWAEAISLCRERSPGAFILADAAHVLFGTMLRLSGPGAISADALVTNCHKWFCGPKGTALLHVAPQHQEWIEPLVISHGFGADFPSGFYWPGLADFSSWLALDEAIEFWDLVGMEAARTYCNYLVCQAAEMLMDAWGTGLGIPLELTGTMALVRLPELAGLRRAGEEYTYIHAEVIQNELYQRRIEVPVKVLSGNLYVRISAHIYNHIDEYAVLQDAIIDMRDGKGRFCFDGEGRGQ